MLRSIKALIGDTLGAADGKLGKVKDVYFDDLSWTVRYLVVDTGSWLADREVLISPVSIGDPDWSGDVVPVNLTTKQVEQSPCSKAHLPVSLQHEKSLATYYDWPFYPEPLGANLTAVIHGDQPGCVEEDPAGESRNPHLRSFHEVKDYAIEATDGQVGHVDDIMVDTEGWKISFVVARTRTWLPGKKAMIAPLAIKEVNWPQQELILGFNKKEVEASPDFEPGSAVNPKVVLVREDYHGKPDV